MTADCPHCGYQIDPDQARVVEALPDWWIVECPRCLLTWQLDTLMELTYRKTQEDAHDHHRAAAGP